MPLIKPLLPPQGPCCCGLVWWQHDVLVTPDLLGFSAAGVLYFVDYEYDSKVYVKVKGAHEGGGEL